MNKKNKTIALLLAAMTVLSFNGMAQQVPLPKTAADVVGPEAGTTLTKEYVQMVGKFAYTWGYAMVNSHNRRAAFEYVTSKNGRNLNEKNKQRNANKG